MQEAMPKLIQAGKEAHSIFNLHFSTPFHSTATNAHICSTKDSKNHPSAFHNEICAKLQRYPVSQMLK